VSNSDIIITCSFHVRFDRRRMLMKKHALSTWTAIGVLALAMPIAVRADITDQTISIPANSALNLDKGTVATSGGDIVYTGNGITFQGSAKGGSLSALGLSGQTGYASVTKDLAPALTAFASTNPIPASSLGVNALFGVVTNGGNVAKALVTAVSGSSITIEFTTFGATGGSGGAGAPTIKSVRNNSSLIPSGFPNSGIAPSSLFVIKGSGLADPTAPDPPTTNQSTLSPGIPSTLFGASVSVTVGGVTTHPAIYHASASEIAAVLPAATPAGAGTVTVSYNGTASAPFNIQVVPSALGLNNYNGGLGAITDANGNIYTFTNSAQPGGLAVIWASGLGADPGDSDTVYTTGPHAVNVALTVYIGGAQADIKYQGASTFPGVNQINVIIPSGLTGCYVPVVGVVGNVVSNVVTIPVATGGGICSEPQLGLTGDKISTITGQSTVKSGNVIVTQGTSPNAQGAPVVSSSASAVFQQVTGNSFVSGGIVSVGGCIVNQQVSGGSTVTATGLDAGTITVTPPGGAPLTLTGVPTLAGFYSVQLAAGAIPASGGTFAFNGSGGTQVGKFSTTINFPNPLLSWTNQAAAATVTRSAGMPVTWTGGGAGTYVYIFGSSLSNDFSAIGTYTCLAPVSAGQFTVPSWVLLSLPPGTGSTSVQNSTAFTTFSASGLDQGFAGGSVSYSAKSTFN
jgi:uncharacterized protein (TIGR03437 family)